jgi:hypothetical protein
VGDLRHEHARVLGIEVDLAALEGRVDQLGAADVLLEHHLVALRLEGLLVELAEHVLLGEVLRAERDRRLCRSDAAGDGGEGRRAARRGDGSRKPPP